MQQPKAAIITGGGRGIGRAISIQVAKEYAVLIVGRNTQDLRDTCAWINKLGGEAEYCTGDVTIESTATRAVEKIKELGWKLDVVVCNAGIGKSSPTHEITTDQWLETFAVNVHGGFYFARAALPTLMAHGSGTICFVSSIAGVRGFAYESAYVASKHAGVGLARSLALEYGKYGITCVAICPGFVEGSMTDRVISGLSARRGLSKSDARQIIERTNPQRRIMSQEEVAIAVGLICDGRLASLTGSPLIMGGGAY